MEEVNVDNDDAAAAAAAGPRLPPRPEVGDGVVGRAVGQPLLGPMVGPWLGPEGVHPRLREAMASIEVGKMGQTFGVQGDAVPFLDGHNAWYIVRNLQEFPPGTVTKLYLWCRRGYTQQAVNIFRDFFRTANLHFISLSSGRLGNEFSRQILSGLHENTSMEELHLDCIGLDGHHGGMTISQLLQRMRNLKTLHCCDLLLRLEGVQALQSGIRETRTLETLKLHGRTLGNEGVALIVEALQDNNTVTHFGLASGFITSASLRHLTRLLQHGSIQQIDLEDNSHLFRDEQETHRFFTALAQSTTTAGLNMNNCPLPDHALVALFQALVSDLCAIKKLGIYHYTAELQGAGLDSLIDNLPLMRRLECLHAKVDFSNPLVLAALRQNTTILHVYRGGRFPREEIVDGPVYDIMVRNQRLCLATKLVAYEAKQIRLAQETNDAILVASTTALFKTLWSWTITECLASDSRGAMAVFFVLREKMAEWIDDGDNATQDDGGDNVTQDDDGHNPTQIAHPSANASCCTVL